MSVQQSCSCSAAPRSDLALLADLGMDAAYAEVSVLACPHCGQHWLRYFYEVEAFSHSGRWYLGAISYQQSSSLSASSARDVLEQLDWYFFGGSYFRGATGKASGPIDLNP